MDFRYAAFNYLYEWACYDRRFIKVLTLTSSSEPEPAVACKELIEVAKHYDIIRNFRIKDEGTERLLPAWNALKRIRKPLTQQEAKQSVQQLVDELKPTYQKELWSAASKFLWMRFQKPIVIYDLITRREVYPNGGGGYDEFYDTWRKKFEENEVEIRAACEALKELSIATKFFGPEQPSKEDFERDVSSDWFAERVFDHALLIGTPS